MKMQYTSKFNHYHLLLYQMYNVYTAIPFVKIMDSNTVALEFT